MKHYSYRPILNDKIVIGIDIDILDINIKKGVIHILPTIKLIYYTTDDYVIFDLGWLIFELRIYIIYKYIKNKWRE